MFKKIVKFVNGKYGIRQFNFYYMAYDYLDLTDEGLDHWRLRDDRWYNDCQHDNLEFVKQQFAEHKRLTAISSDTGTAI